MTATLTIAFSDDLLAALKKNKALKLSLGGSPNGRAASARDGRLPAGRRGGRTAKSANGYREGSHPARLVAWVTGRKRSFGVADVMKALGVKRSHANMVLTRVVRDRVVKRRGRGEYGAA